ncbi:hypothetical protein NC653_000618 [Populus alba x Populus x berolinensis]|uniref:Uncharacterized protein n=1 Tax=Populus alba x Populus x berolinensis TaxID=444605 RepID=A0AAD6RJ19_9ROSI|nr:hypothetical protein NC653_000618 [Populus alba x Populus x berolinensis]
MKRLLAAAVRPPLGGGSFVASVLVRETVACGRWKREDLSTALSVAERSTAGREKIWYVAGCSGVSLEKENGAAVLENGRDRG